MKKNLFTYIAVAFLFTAATTACNKDFLERKPLNEYEESDVWKDVGLVQAFVNDLYVQMRPGYLEVMLSSMTDESRFIHDYSTSRVVQGNITADDIGRLDDFARWDDHYKRIRNCNMFFERVGGVSFTDQKQRERLIGEVHFMRAWYYHLLVKYYGGVPLITKTFNIKGDEQEILNIKRAPFADCVKFISDECDSAAVYLSDSYEAVANKGRVTRGAALALKSRILLFAASEAFDGAANELQGYTSGGLTARLTAARDAAKVVIDLNQYALYQPTTSPVENYTRIFLDKDHKELIFIKQYDRALLGTSHDLYNGPNGYHNWGGNVPIENFVSGYQMKDGSAFSWSTPSQAKAPYVDRDPRFYATILYDGASWKPRPSDAALIDGKGVIQTGKYESTNGKDSIWGLDTRSGPIENWNGSFSGYYLRKFMDKNLDAQFFRGDQNWIFFRYAEILLNYAEASIKLGGAFEADGRDKLNMVRTRAGMPATTATGQALLSVLKYERRYELAFEEHRFFDARRWKDADAVFNQNALGIEVLGSFIAGHPFTYRPYSIQDRAFPAGKYLIPIPANEIRKNSNLVQQSYYK